jgi:hypothetical protein
MAWKITTRRGVGSGTFRRDGLAFNEQATYLENLTPGLEQEYLLFCDGKGALVFEEVPAAEAAPIQTEALLTGTGAESPEDLAQDLNIKSIGELRALARRIGLQVEKGAGKAELIEALQAKLTDKGA